MRFPIVLLMLLLAGCQFSPSRHSATSSDVNARSGAHGFENGSIRVFGKSWGEYGRSLARIAAYQKLYRMAFRSGHTHFYIVSENRRHIESGRWSLLPLATKTDDYHSLRLNARLYRGSKGTPDRALRIDWLRQQIENANAKVEPPAESLREVILRRPAEEAVPENPVKVAAKPVKKPASPSRTPVPSEKPLVIKAPES